MFATKRSFTRLGFASAVALASAVAAAQNTPLYGKLTLGTPTSSVRDDVSGLTYGAAVGYSFRPRIQNLDLAAELSYLRGDGHDNWYHTFDLMAKGRYSFSGATGFYAGLGAGVSFSEVHADGDGAPAGGGGPIDIDAVFARAQPFDTATSRTRSLWSGVVEPLVGYRIDRKSFVELSYRITPKNHGADLNAITVSYGLRF